MSTSQIAARVQRIKESPSTAAAERVRQLRSQGRHILSLTVGEPDFDTPEHIKQAAIRAAADGETKYTSVNGTPALRTAILDRVERHTGVAYDVNQLTVGVGGKQVIFMALMATLDTGDEVVIPAPYWVSYPDMVLANDGTPVIVDTREDDGFKLTPASLRAALTPRTRWIILNTPSNPTGAVYTADELRALAAVLDDFPRVMVLTDEIYDEIYYGDGKVISLVEAAPGLRERVFLVNGVSKTYAMTGWRIGYGLGPSFLVKAINTLISQITSCPASISQAAAAAALSGDQSFVPKTVAVYKERRDLVVAGINAVPGLSAVKPDGAFYAYVNCSGLIGRTTPKGVRLDDDEAVALFLLDEAGVAVVHGAAYGLSPYFRISFATDKATISQALAAIDAAVRTLV
ncbi:aspartate transaminase [Brooklawnia cerclae]|uniref:Aminotransferase n=1 Tax=Brooklawnia cerclae TaxID=349934 RepID=A0ABX0SLX9_9ACTN|nr:aspartate transaminase [Brooklawnia cerclae]NIH57771.1 aspartate aminotransferase [Brooklawnia cerclae]